MARIDWEALTSERYDQQREGQNGCDTWLLNCLSSYEGLKPPVKNHLPLVS